MPANLGCVKDGPPIRTCRCHVCRDHFKDKTTKLPRAFCGWGTRIDRYVERMREGEHTWTPHQWLTSQRVRRCARCGVALAREASVELVGKIEIPACDECRGVITEHLRLEPIPAPIDASVLTELSRWHAVASLLHKVVGAGGGNPERAAESPEALYEELSGVLHRVIDERDAAEDAQSDLGALNARLTGIVGNVPRTARKVRRKLTHHHGLRADSVDTEKAIEGVVATEIRSLLGIGEGT